jgi:hypothetical protein
MEELYHLIKMIKSPSHTVGSETMCSCPAWKPEAPCKHIIASPSHTVGLEPRIYETGMGEVRINASPSHAVG